MPYTRQGTAFPCTSAFVVGGESMKVKSKLGNTSEPPSWGFAPLMRKESQGHSRCRGAKSPAPLFEKWERWGQAIRENHINHLLAEESYKEEIRPGGTDFFFVLFDCEVGWLALITVFVCVVLGACALVGVD